MLISRIFRTLHAGLHHRFANTKSPVFLHNINVKFGTMSDFILIANCRNSRCCNDLVIYNSQQHYFTIAFGSCLKKFTLTLCIKTMFFRIGKQNFVLRSPVHFSKLCFLYIPFYCPFILIFLYYSQNNSFLTKIYSLVRSTSAKPHFRNNKTDELSTAISS